MTRCAIFSGVARSAKVLSAKGIMEIKGKVHCFFEQSGTFKNEFKKLGIDALDYDIHL